ncbi:MAG: hypothetical protein JW940_13915 [Polyangiaceae bacterium]|nr:hypothetical protein [Polyangiaceae bacterium]
MKAVIAIPATLTALALPGVSWAAADTDIEVGAVLASRNDVRIPGKGGTKFSFVEDLSTRAAPVFRVRVGYRFAERHVVTALYAPLRVNATGRIDRDIVFAGGAFPADTPVLAVYRFDSYRLTYRYSFVATPDLELAAGLTAKLRDAEVSLYGADVRRKTNTGFVPLVNLHVAWRPNHGAFGMVLDADALAAPQGRAEDVLLAATWRARDNVELRAGYRMLEGGSDIDEVYSFAWFHYAVAGVQVGF